MPNHKPIERKTISDAQLKNEMIKLFESGNTDNTNIYEQIRTKYKLAKERHVKFYHSTLKEWQKTKEQATNNQIQTNAKEGLKSGLKSKIELQLEIQKEIEQLQKILNDGYLSKKVTFDGKTEVKREVFGTKEIESYHRMIDNKRNELFKLDGMYAPTKVAETDKDGNNKKLPTGSKIFFITPNE